MRNKITIDMEKECGCDCECIVSEANGKNTLELYMWGVGVNPSIEISWVKNGGSAELDDSRYDVNGDGKITEADVNEILQASVNGTYDEKYDLNYDGYVNAYDALLVQKKIAEDDTPEESGSAILEGEFLDNGDYYCLIPLEYISGNRYVTLKVKGRYFESKPVYFNCINISEKTDFIVTRNLSCDDTYTVIAVKDDKSLPIATTSTTGVIKVGNGLAIAEDGTLSVVGGMKIRDREIFSDTVPMISMKFGNFNILGLTDNIQTELVG